ncbi:c-type cytochrome [Rubrolithibacter danxiaensis]|uniref:c-type cytochrome n=1 Tax=Rubrolithibacter danxiaensis TaxID=3390805 RepID=UPI003BF8C573
MKIPVQIKAVLLIGGFSLLYACGNADQSSTSNEEATTTESSAATTEAAVVTDPEAKSESKGVGKFTSVEIGALDKGLAEKGKTVFEAKCSSCHKTTNEKLVGPGLKDVTKRREPEWIMNMITNPQEMTQKDAVAKALFEKHLVQMTFQNVSDDETRQILEFFRENDSQ